MFGKLMNNYYYGKSGKGDYRKEDLPKNRWELFWEMLRVRLSGLMRLNLMYVVAWLPALLVILLNVSGWYGTLGSMLNEAGQLTGDVIGMTNSVLGGFCLLMIPCLLITGPCTAGLTYVTRNWARDEHAFIWADFKDAIKANWKQALGVSAITSVVPILVYTGWNVYGQMASQISAFMMIPRILMLMVGLVWYLMLLYLYPLMVTYELSFKNLLRNALLLALGRLPQSLGLRLLTTVPTVIAVVVLFFVGQLQWVLLVAILYYILFGFAFSRFVTVSYANAAFDRYINIHIAGAQVNRGLSQEEDDDFEDEETDEE